MFVIFAMINVALVGSAWSGPPPADIVFYGYVYINGSIADSGTPVEIYANSGTLLMDSGTVGAGGYFPGVTMTWDDPDTGGDEGIEYSDNGEAIKFKVDGLDVQYPDSIYVLTSEAGQSKEITLKYIYNFEPVLEEISNVTINEDEYLSFIVYAEDNNSYRNDTLIFSENSPGSFSGVALINSTLNRWRSNFSWIPNNENVGLHNYTFRVSDDGRPSKQDSQVVEINIMNTNDAPIISLSDKNAYKDMVFSYDVSEVCNDIDPTNDSLSFYDNTSDFNIDQSSGIISFTPSSVGEYDYRITCCDNSSASNNCTSDNFRLTVSELTGIVIVKNVYYLEKTPANVTYRIDDTVYNFIGSDVENLILTDPDVEINDSLNITHRNYITLSKNITINKSDNSTPYDFAAARAVVNGTPYFSNEPRVLIPGTGGPFDINITVYPESVNANDRVYGDLTMINQNPDVSQDVILTYWIEDTSGKRYDSAQETLYVAANSSLNYTVDLYSPDSAGDYFFFAEIIWGSENNESAVAYDHFVVVSQKKPSGGGGGGGTSGPDEKEKDEEKEEEKEEDDRGEIVPEEKEEKIETPSIPVISALLARGEIDLDELANLLLILIAILLLISGIGLRILAEMPKSIVFDAESLILAVKNNIGLRDKLKEKFKTYQIVVSEFTVKDLKRIVKKGPNDMKDIAKTLLWSIEEFNIPIKRTGARTEKKAFEILSRKMNTYVVIYDKSEIRYMVKNNLRTYYIDIKKRKVKKK